MNTRPLGRARALRDPEARDLLASPQNHFWLHGVFTVVEEYFVQHPREGGIPQNN